MIKCSSCGKEMDIFEGTKVTVLQCLKCNLKIELPASKDGKINYHSISISDIPKTSISDILIVELQKRINDIDLMNDMSLKVKLTSLRDLEIVAKYLKREEISFKTDNEQFNIVISKHELVNFYDQLTFREEIKSKIHKFFRSVKFIKSYLINLEQYLNYSHINDIGRLVFLLPNESISLKIQRILLISKIYFIQLDNNSIYLPWNSVLYLNSFITFQYDLKTQYLNFLVQKWQMSTTYHRSVRFEKEISLKQGKKLNKSENKHLDVLSKTMDATPKKKKRKITEFF